MWPEMLDWTVCRDAAAPEKLPESAIATKAASWRRSTRPVWLGQPKVRAGTVSAWHSAPPVRWVTVPAIGICPPRRVFDLVEMALQPERARAVAARGPRSGRGPDLNGGADLGRRMANRRPEREPSSTGAPSGQFWPAEAPHGPPPGNGAPVAEAPHAPPGNGVRQELERRLAERTPVSPVSLVASLQARSLGELISGAIAAGFAFRLGRQPGLGVCSHAGAGCAGQAAGGIQLRHLPDPAPCCSAWSAFLMLGRSAARDGCAPVGAGQPFKSRQRVLAAGGPRQLWSDWAASCLSSSICRSRRACRTPARVTCSTNWLLARGSGAPCCGCWAGGTLKLKRRSGWASHRRAVSRMAGWRPPPRGPGWAAEDDRA